LIDKDEEDGERNNQEMKKLKNELLTITVEIGNGDSENLLIYDDDTAEEVTEKFC
jgi:hypothetical protein